jgi:hypothetical protein
MLDTPFTPSQPVVAVVIALVLFALGRLFIRRVTRSERDPWLARVLTVCLILHIVAPGLQIWVVDHLYGGIADWLGYDHQGAILSTGFRHFDFSLAPAHLHGIVSDGIVSIIVGVVFTLIGVNQLGAFVIFSWLAFVGIVFFYRAYVLTFGGAGHRRYGYLVCFLPTLIFWTSDVSKEALMVFLLGLISYGAAKILTGRPGGYPLVIGASAASAIVRPNELFLAMAGFTAAMLIRQSDGPKRISVLRRIVTVVFVGSVLAGAFVVTNRYLPGSTGSVSLQRISKRLQAGNYTGPGFGSSYVGYSSSPLYYPRDIYTVLFDPLPINAHGKGELLAAFESTFLLALILTSLRRLWKIPRVSLARPYVLMCIVFCGGFLYAFAALSNLGLITRERTVMLPFLLVPLSIPLTSAGDPPRHEWELNRWQRLQRRRRRMVELRRLRTEPGRPTVTA